jgi:hypothetical protein
MPGEEPCPEPSPLTIHEYYLLARAFAGFRATLAGPPATRCDEAAADALSWEERDRVAAACGRWVRDRLDAAGAVISAARPKLRLPLRSRVWLCFADHEGLPCPAGAPTRLWAGPLSVLGRPRSRY